MIQIYKDIIESLERFEKIAIATIARAHGSTPRREGAKMLIFPDGTFHGTVGGGIFESIVIQDALGVLRDGKITLKTYSFNPEGTYATGAVCGGQVEVLIEMIRNVPQLLIIGGGHVGQALAKSAHILGFGVTIVDDREEYAETNENGSKVKMIHTPPDYTAIPMITENTYICIVSKGYLTDEIALRRVIQSPAKYIGMIGSKKKIQTVYHNMQADGINPALFDRVHAPIGINIGADSPEEIAISILAEIISIKNQTK